MGATDLSVAGYGFLTSFVLQQFPEWSDGSRMRFREVLNKVVSLMEISFCSIFILLFGGCTELLVCKMRLQPGKRVWELLL